MKEKKKVNMKNILEVKFQVSEDLGHKGKYSM